MGSSDACMVIATSQVREQRDWARGKLHPPAIALSSSLAHSSGTRTGATLEHRLAPAQIDSKTTSLCSQRDPFTMASSPPASSTACNAAT
jgi:hypothetical protein